MLNLLQCIALSHFNMKKNQFDKLTVTKKLLEPFVLAFARARWNSTVEEGYIYGQEENNCNLLHP